MADVFWLFTIILTAFSVVVGTFFILRFEEYDAEQVEEFLYGNRTRDLPIIIGHRGCMLDCPENTLTSFQVASESGAFGVEFDVDFTNDGHAVVIHDATVDRTTDGHGKVKDFTLENIKKLNAIRDFKSSKDIPFTPIPTLVEAIETCLELNVKMFIEVKAYQDAIKAAELLKILFKKYDLYKKAIVLSFYPNVIYQMRKADPKILVIHNWTKYHLSYERDGTPKHSQLAMTILARIADFILEMSIHFWLAEFLRFPFLIAHHSDVSETYVNFWRSANVHVLVYGVTNKYERDYFHHLGVPVIVDKVRELASKNNK